MPYAEIKPHFALSALDQLHAELAGKIEQNKEEADRLAEGMRHVEAVIKLLDPSYNVRRIAVRRKRKNPYFKRGTIFRSVLELLRDAAAPMTATEITTALLVAKGVFADTSDDEHRNLFSGVQASLRRHDGKTVRNVAHGIPAKWELIR